MAFPDWSRWWGRFLIFSLSVAPLLLRLDAGLKARMLRLSSSRAGGKAFRSVKVGPLRLKGPLLPDRRDVMALPNLPYLHRGEEFHVMKYWRNGSEWGQGEKGRVVTVVALWSSAFLCRWVWVVPEKFILSNVQSDENLPWFG